MSKLVLILCAAVGLTAAFVPSGAAEETIPPGVYVILDGSGSMWGQLADGQHKITAARDVLAKFSPDDYEGRELAFRVYGHRREGDCSDTELVVAFTSPSEAIAAMSTFADQVNPKGRTPITRSLRAALEDFGDRPGEIILVSDGIETCDGDPCELMKEWSEKNVQVRVHVVGLGLEEKERAAMECISSAAGTPYHDAQSTDELTAGLQKIRETQEPEPAPGSEWYGLAILATTDDGERVRVYGTAQTATGESMPIGNNGYQRPPPGETTVTVGVRTRNGTIYRPITATVDVAPSGRTDLEVRVEKPPTVEAVFLEEGNPTRGSYVTAYQDGEEVFGFRARDVAFVDPGKYEFRARPNSDNELSVTESFDHGDAKEIVFELIPTVHVMLRMISTGSERDFRSNFELWQAGEKMYDLHRGNGARVRPGIYDVRLPLRLTPYLHEGLVVTTASEQEYVLEVPVGHVTITYRNADGSPGPSKRCFLERLEEGRYQSDRISLSGDRIPLVPGSYRVKGWSQLGTFDDVSFEIEVGDELTIELKSKT